MSVILSDIADAIVDELKANDWTSPAPVAPIRQNKPHLKREDMTRINLVVTAKSRRTERITRDKRKHSVVVLVGIQTSLDGVENDESDQLIELGEEIEEHFSGWSMSTTPFAKVVDSQFGNGDESPFFADRDEDSMMIYTGVIRLELETII